jgi:integrase
MSRHGYSASTLASASTLLPREDLLPIPPARPRRVAPGTFTKITMRTMHCPQAKSEAFFWDPSCSGFGLRALRSGRRTWIYQYRNDHGKTRRIALGDVSAVSLEDAREAARHKAASVTHGSDPSAERKRKRAAGSVLEVIDSYLAYAEKRQRPRSYKETKRHLRAHAAPIHHAAAEAVRRRDIGALLENVAQNSGLVAANRVRSTLSAMWIWGLRTGLIEGESNPVSFTVRHPEKARERVLSDAELRAVWNATDDGTDYSRITRLCLLTGCRREEIAGLRWDEVQVDKILIDSARMKGKQAHEIALLPMICATLPKCPELAEGCVFGRRGTGFSGFSDSKEKLDSALANSGAHIAPWGLHDLRRTFSTRLHDAGVEPLVIEALLAHKQQGVAAIYNRASFREAKRSALMRWHEIVVGVIREA